MDDRSTPSNNEVEVDDVVTEKVTTSKKKSSGFPKELLSFSYADRAHLICGNELEPKPKDSTDADNYLEVAQKIVAYKDDDYYFVIDDLTAPNLRKLANMFGLRNLGSAT